LLEQSVARVGFITRADKTDTSSAGRRIDSAPAEFFCREVIARDLHLCYYKQKFFLRDVKEDS
jgi:hypothetical protein